MYTWYFSKGILFGQYSGSCSLVKSFISIIDKFRAHLKSDSVVLFSIQARVMPFMYMNISPRRTGESVIQVRIN